MKRRPIAGAALAVVALSLGALTGPANAQSIEINIVDNPPTFSPRKPDALPAGATFHWNWPSGSFINHNVRQDKRLFRSGNAGFREEDYPDGFGIQASAGTFHYYCEVHGSPNAGQNGRISVVPYSGDGPDGLPFKVTWANGNTDTGGRFDIRFRVGHGNWRDWRRNTSKHAGVFGKGDEPVDVREGRAYTFKARSQKGSNDDKVSGWSPKLRVET